VGAFHVICLVFVGCSGRSPQHWVHSATNIRFGLVPAGEFVMGSPADEPGHQPDEQQHRVRLTHAFYISIHEVTRRQWSAVMPVEPIGISEGDRESPVVNVSWLEVGEFIDRLNRLGDGRFRLPTEAEWEYACRARTTTAYAMGAILSSDQANYDGRFPLPGQPTGASRGRLTPVGSFAPNAWGLHDMHGNAWEWTADAYCSYGGDDVDPQATCDDPLKVIRGGSWRFDADSARCALRYTHRPQDRGDSLGFRLARSIE
jgi:formylglycine-generating enzyme required for sulfatase activity